MLSCFLRRIINFVDTRVFSIRISFVRTLNVIIPKLLLDRLMRDQRIFGVSFEFSSFSLSETINFVRYTSSFRFNFNIT